MKKFKAWAVSTNDEILTTSANKMAIIFLNKLSAKRFLKDVNIGKLEEVEVREVKSKKRGKS